MWPRPLKVRVVLALLAVVLGATTTLASVAAAKGVVAGTFRAKLHDPVPLVKPEEGEAEFERVVDSKKLSAAPNVDGAGAHADLTISSVFSVSGLNSLTERTDLPSNIHIDLPPGLMANIGLIPECTRSEFESTVYKNETPHCPPDSQVGVVSAVFGGQLPDRSYPLYKTYSVDGHLTEFGFPYEFLFDRVPVLIRVDLRTSSDYGITLSERNASYLEFVPAPFVTLWADPWSSIHDSERWNTETDTWGASVSAPPVPFITNSSDCNGGVLESKMQMLYWYEGENWLPSDPEDFAYRSFLPEPAECEGEDFSPSLDRLSSSPEGGASAGMDLDLNSRRGPDTATPGPAPIKDASISLPEGTALNPAAANGLAGCTAEEVGVLEASGAADERINFDDEDARCPDASKIGNGTIETPLVDEPMRTEVFFATPYRNPYKAPWAIYLVAHSKGFTSKLAGRVDLDPGTGRPVVAFENLPQVPVEGVHIHLFDGARAALATAPVCGAKWSEARLLPWSATAAAAPTVLRALSSIDTGAGGSPCSSSTGALPFSPSFTAGTLDPIARGQTAFLMRIKRTDAEQEIKGVSLRLPGGLIADTRAATECSDSDIAKAISRDAPGDGVVELKNPSCPSSSQIGSIDTGMGAGSILDYAKGSIYLAGPYRGAPFSLVTITPAVAGGTAQAPLLDFGTQVVRVAVEIDRRTGEITASSDPFPELVDGVPLRIRDVILRIDRPGLLRNPSGCHVGGVVGRAEGSSGTVAALKDRFQVGGCWKSRFRPRLGLDVSHGGGSKGSARLRAVLRSNPGGTGIASVGVALPASLRLASGRAITPCVSAFASKCPKRALVGQATALTPMADGRQKGPIYLHSAQGGRRQLVVLLKGQAPIELTGTLSVVHHRTQIWFRGLPDFPFSKLAMVLTGRLMRLTARNRRPCGDPSHFVSRFVAQDGRHRTRAGVVSGTCGLRQPSDHR